MAKKWVIKPAVDPKIQAEFPEIGPTLLQLLWNRGLRDQAAIDEFLNADWGQDVYDPFLFKDMARACEIIYQHIAEHKKIAVYGDYDADGVCGAVILTDVLRQLGADTEIYIPHREREGYGLNSAAVSYLADKKVKLIITCDCGVANIEEVDLARSLGMKVIITDHHQLKEKLPAAEAIIHVGVPGEKYPCHNLSGGATAFKLVQGLLHYSTCPFTEPEREIKEKWLLDLVAISLVADMIPLLGEARTLVKYGLVVLAKTRRLGLKKLIEIAGLNQINTNSIGWQIAPRINAAGRMDHANASFELLITGDEIKAAELARSLNLTNTDRQKTTDLMLEQAVAQIGDKPQDYIITAYQPDWGLGLVGLVAGKLVQIYHKPALVMCSEGDYIVGSGRSIHEFDLIDLLNKNADKLDKFGGHKQAAGFKLKKENYENFITSCQQITQDSLKDLDLTPVIEIDKEVNLADATWQLQEQVAQLEPTGYHNPVPLFVTKNLMVSQVDKVGSNGQHTRYLLKQGEMEKKFIAFGTNLWEKAPLVGDNIDVVWEIGVNQWNGNRELQYKIYDYKINQ